MKNSVEVHHVKSQKCHLISWCGTFVETYRPNRLKLCRNIREIRKLGEILGFYIVITFLRDFFTSISKTY